MKPGDTTTAERREVTDPVTGRKIIQLTSGPWYDYPLYYFIPSVTKDGKSLVFHRLRDGEMQYHRLDIETGRTVCLTGARSPAALWRPWIQPPAVGPREYLGALNTETNELLYFDDHDLRAVQIYTLADRFLLRVPEDRVPCGLTGVSADGRYFVYPHADREWWEASRTASPERLSLKDCRIEVADLTEGRSRAILCLNWWITHANFYDSTRILLSHAPTHQGILLTDIEGGWYHCLRAPMADGRQTCHYQATRRGVMYELNDYGPNISREHGVMGVYDPDTHKRREYRVGARITHIGYDPEGLLWFGEKIQEAPRLGRVIGYCPRLSPDSESAFIPLTEPVTTHGNQFIQRAHVHPALMPDRRHILFLRGDERTGTNHPCLLDISGVRDTIIEEGA